MRKKNYLLSSISIVLFGVLTFLSSCVQGDFSELYDEDLSSSNMIPRNKKTKELSQEQCGICCMSYIKYRSVESQYTHMICNAAVKSGIDLNYTLSFDDIAKICKENSIGGITQGVGIHWNVNGVSVVDHGPVISTLNTISTSQVIIGLTDGPDKHFVVGTSRNNETQIVTTYDPKYGGTGQIDYDDVVCVCY